MVKPVGADAWVRSTAHWILRHYHPITLKPVVVYSIHTDKIGRDSRCWNYLSSYPRISLKLGINQLVSKMCPRSTMLHVTDRYDLRVLKLGIWWVVVIDVEKLFSAFR